MAEHCRRLLVDVHLASWQPKEMNRVGSFHWPQWRVQRRKRKTYKFSQKGCQLKVSVGKVSTNCLKLHRCGAYRAKLSFSSTSADTASLSTELMALDS